MTKISPKTKQKKNYQNTPKHEKWQNTLETFIMTKIFHKTKKKTKIPPKHNKSQKTTETFIMIKIPPKTKK